MITLNPLPLAVLLAATAAVADPQTEMLVGGIDAIVQVCTPIDAKVARTGTDLLEKTVAERKLDLAAVRRSANHQSVYNAEVNRLLALPAKDRAAACRAAF